MADRHNSAIAATVDALQSAGRNVYIFGYSADERRALIVDRDREVVSIANVDGGATLGRWECTMEHLNTYSGLYGDRFPLR